MRLIYLLLIAGLILLYSGCTTSNGKVDFRHDETNNKVDVYLNDKYFTSYFYPEGFEKPVLFPIHTSSGKDITRGYPFNSRPYERIDHPHHVGLWLNFGNVNGLDFWNNSFRVNPENAHRYGSIVHRSIERKDPRRGALVTSSDWVDNNNQVHMNEITTFVFGENKDGVRTIKRTSKLIAARDVVIKGDKEGLLGLRMDRAFEEPSTRPLRLLDGNAEQVDEPILNNEGVNGVYRNMDGDVGGDVWSKRSPWVALRGVKENEVITVAIFDNKENPYYPAWSHARGYGLFAVNNLGGKGMYPDAENVEITLAPDESISFTHLIVIGGDFTDDELNAYHNDFNNW